MLNEMVVDVINQTQQELFQQTDDYSELAILLALLRSLNILHQSHHWQSEGNQFYSDHLLFQRLYEKIQDEIDIVGEKTVGLGKPYLTNYFKQLKMIKLFLKTLTDSNVSYTLNSYRAELFAVEFIEEIIQRLKLKEFLSSGLEQTLGTIQETHEQFCYLLKQQTRETSY
jgi:DNA-binding ferritin-like protein